MPELLSIGELSRHTGVAPSALRYYEELGLLRPTTRVANRRLYAPIAIGVVGVVLLLRDLGFSLAEAAALMRARADSPSAWRIQAEQKLEELDARIEELHRAREALHHGLTGCTSPDIVQCPVFQEIIQDRVQASAQAAAAPAGAAADRPSCGRT